MAQHPPRTGVCLIRIEAQDTYFLVTVRRNRDISNPAGEVVSHFAEVKPVLMAVREFLEEFTTCTTAP